MRIKKLQEFVNESANNVKLSECISVDYDIYPKDSNFDRFGGVNEISEIIPYFSINTLKVDGKSVKSRSGKPLHAIHSDYLKNAGIDYEKENHILLEIKTKSGVVLVKTYMFCNWGDGFAYYFWGGNDVKVGKGHLTTIEEYGVFINGVEIGKVSDPFFKKKGGQFKYKGGHCFSKYSGASHGGKTNARISATFTIEKNGIVTFVVDTDEKTKINKRDELVKKVFAIANKIDADNGFYMSGGDDTPETKHAYWFMQGTTTSYPATMDDMQRYIDNVDPKKKKLSYTKPTDKQVAYASSLCKQNIDYGSFEILDKLMSKISKEHISQLINMVASYYMPDEIKWAQACYDHYIDWYKVK